MNKLVIKNNKQAVTTSLMIAEVFNKRHDHVLRDVEEHIMDLSKSGNPKLGSEMFVESTYVNRGKEYKQYFMNKDGFTLLAMSFTGKKALEFKIKYIEAFNKMEKQLISLAPTNLIDALQLALTQAKEIEMKEQIINELKPRADYTDSILKSKSLVTITQIAKDYGLSGAALNKLLHELEVQYKQSDQWLLYRKYQNMGFTHSETIKIVRSDERPDVKMNTKWTQKGRLFLYDLLKENGVIPNIEKE